MLYLILSGKASGWDGGLGQNGWGTGYLGEYNMVSALVFEVVATFLFLVCILGVTRKGTPLHIAGFAGMAIGLTLAVIHIVGINVTGVSVNPARSLGPALLVGGAGASPGLAVHRRAAGRRRHRRHRLPVGPRLGRATSRRETGAAAPRGARFQPLFGRAFLLDARCDLLLQGRDALGIGTLEAAHVGTAGGAGRRKACASSWRLPFMPIRNGTWL